MLYRALFVPPGQHSYSEEILERPEIKRYVSNWGQQSGDLALVAVKNDVLIGAIWGRCFSEEEKGYGYIDECTPEISMALKSSFRNRGIGSERLKRISSSYMKLGYSRISLSVDIRNNAKRLYERSGFLIYRMTGDHTITMVKHLK